MPTKKRYPITSYTAEETHINLNIVKKKHMNYSTVPMAPTLKVKLNPKSRDKR